MKEIPLILMKKNLAETSSKYNLNVSVYCIVLFCFLGLIGCIPPEQKTTQVEVDIIGDPVQSEILELGYRRELDSLLYYFEHPNATYRYLSASAFNSFQTKEAIDSLVSCLDDPVPEVVEAAVRALGQQRDKRVERELISRFVKVDSSGAWLKVNQAILEAMGKLGTKESHDFIATTRTYLPIDSVLILGQTRALFNFSTRKITDEKGVRKCLEILGSEEYQKASRMYTAHYLSRCDKEDLVSFADTVLAVLKFEREVDLIVPLIKAVAKTGTTASFYYLINVLDKSEDERIKVAIVESLHQYEAFQKNIHTLAVQKIPVESVKVASSLCDYLYQHGNANYARLYWQLAKSKQLSPDVSIRLYAIAFKHMPLWHVKRMAWMRYELYQSYLNSKDVYYKAKLIESLGENIDNVQFVSDSLLERIDNPVLHTSLSKAYSSFLKAKVIPLLGNKKRTILLDSIAIGVESLLNTQNVGSLSVLAEALRKPSFRDSIWINRLQEKKESLTLPRDYEAYLELDKTVAYLSNDIFDKDKLPELPLKQIKLDSSILDRKALVKTSSGTFIIELLDDIAPFTVSNFIDLCEEGYFDNKNFHRVVNNFVVQGGCSIGDGYGSLDYVISSELPKAYYEESGFVGMASAGLHTGKRPMVCQFIANAASQWTLYYIWEGNIRIAGAA